MKELSIEQKAQRYDEAIEIAKEINNEQRAQPFNVMTKVFPELKKESEDEKIRKKLIAFINEIWTREDLPPLLMEDDKDEFLAWLEKQGEHANFRNKIEIGDKVTRNEDGVLVNLSQLNRVAKPADNVIKPKFHKGDWVIHQGTENAYQVVAVIDNQYQLKYGDNYTVQKRADVDRCARLYDVTKDAKDGDVLATDGGVCIFDGTLEEGEYPFAYCGITKRGFESYNRNLPFSHDNNIHPATKEQRDLLFQKMKEAGYVWDTEKKELKKIEQKPAEWNEEDEPYLDHVITAIKSYYTDDKGCENPFREELLRWLKSLRPQKQWKPSEEQMDALESAIVDSISSIQKHSLESLYNELKKLF